MNNAAISHSNEKFIKATSTDLSYEMMKVQLKKVFEDLSLSVASNKNNYVKLGAHQELTYEPTYNKTKE